uniref:Putative tick salivary metalloprotease n=1 Tax=Rhipicephalus pulchellus TaxID=72859 RepID=L7LTX6_RHIPC
MQNNQLSDTNAREMFVIAINLLLLFCWCARAEKEIITYPIILEERMNGAGMILKITEDITLNLERSSVLADELLFVTSGKTEDHVEKVNTSFVQKEIYHDTHRQSSVMVRSIDGAVRVEGILGSELRIKPLLQGARSLEGQIPHKIYEVEEKADSRPIGLAYAQTGNSGRGGNRWSNNARKHGARNPQGKPDAFVVEVHMISDMKHQRDFRKNEDIIAYMAVMTNAVNLRYVDMSRPKISFILVGITRSTDDAFAAMEQGLLNARETLRGIEKYMNNGRVPGNPDIVFLVSGLDMFNRPDGKMNKALGGLAYVGTVCGKRKIGEAEDTATTYSGTYAIAHELCHVLGAPHDETPECPWKEGYLMSYVDGGIKKFRLSRCSERSIRNIYQKLRLDCIDVQTKTNYMSKHKKYPGQIVGALYYCEKTLKKPGIKYYIKLNDALSSSCKMECCYPGFFTNYCTRVDILPGMSCGKGKTCRRGVCGVHKFL